MQIHDNSYFNKHPLALPPSLTIEFSFSITFQEPEIIDE